jgi:hypothetical protein
MKEFILDGIEEIRDITSELHAKYLEYISGEDPICERFYVFRAAPEDWKEHGGYLRTGDGIPGWDHRNMDWERYRNIDWEWIIENMAESSGSGVDWDSIPDDLQDKDWLYSALQRFPDSFFAQGVDAVLQKNLGSYKYDW